MTALWQALGYTVAFLLGGYLILWAYDELICRPLDRIDWIRLYIRAAWRLRGPVDIIASAAVRTYLVMRYGAYDHTLTHRDKHTLTRNRQHATLLKEVS